MKLCTIIVQTSTTNGNIQGHWFQPQGNLNTRELNYCVTQVSLPTYIPKVVRIQLPFENIRYYGVKYSFSTYTRKRRITYVNNKNDGVYIYKSMDNRWHFLDVNDSSSLSYNVENAVGIIPPVKGWVLTPEDFQKSVSNVFDEDPDLINSVRKKLQLTNFCKKYNYKKV